MKTLKTFITYFFFAFFVANNLSAQSINHYPVREQGHWKFGINAGTAYQRSDIANLYHGYGVGFTLGKNLYYRPKGLFSFDMRGRLLYAESYGLDGSRSIGIKNNNALNGIGRPFDDVKLDYTRPKSVGYYFANRQTRNGTLDFEGVLTFNRLRERTGVVLSLYGGLGLDWYQTRINQRNGSESYAAFYKTVDSVFYGAAKVQLKNGLDKTYETIADGNNENGNLTWMPTAGIELGYQFTPRFHAGFFHKINFTRSDIFDGQQFLDNNNVTYENDWQHYTGLKMEWDLGKINKKCDAPIVEITLPTQNPYITEYADVRVNGNVKNVNGAIDVTCRLNGYEQRFDYKKGYLTSDLRLRNGRNEFEIEAKNACGTDKEMLIIIYNEPRRNEPTTSAPPKSEPPVTQNPPIVVQPSPPVVLQQIPKPVVTLTNPSRNSTTVEEDYFTIRATILNVKNERDVRFTVGRTEKNFNFDPRTGVFSSTIYLQEGRNEITIEGRNPSGRDEANAVIFYQRKVEIARPSVSIVSPNDGQRFSQSEITLEARTLNVTDKKEIRVYVNDILQRDFNFNSLNKKVTGDIRLREGNNTITVRADNSAGSDMATVNVIYTVERPKVNPPSVSITTPNNNSTTEKEFSNVRATTNNINSKSQITININGRRRYDFSLYGSNIEFGTRLQEGNNNITVVVENESGKDQATVNVTYRKPTPPKVPDVVRNPRQPKTDEPTTGTGRLPRLPRTETTPKEDNPTPTTGRLPRQPRTETEPTNPTTGRGGRNFAPKVEITSVSRNVGDPMTPATGASTVLATLTNVSEKSEITFTLNGKNMPFDFENGNFSADIELAKGENTVIVSVATKNGKASDSKKVTY